MSLQWPLILFTLFMCLAGGIFFVSSFLAFKGEGRGIQIPALASSVICLVVGGIAVFFHLQHWERIFNGFGHLTSGITQELIAIVIFIVVAVIYFAQLRRADQEGEIVPRWCAIMGMIISVVLVIVMSHSYNMPSRPAWDSVFLILYYAGNAFLFGSLFCAALQAAKGEKTETSGSLSRIAGIANVVTTLAYSVYWNVAAGSFSQVGQYFDPTHPTKDVVSNAAGMMNVFSGPEAAVFWIGVIVVGTAVPLASVYFAQHKNNEKSWKTYAATGLIAAVAGAVCMRCLFYILGASVFMYY